MQALTDPDSPQESVRPGNWRARMERRALMMRWPYMCAMSTLLLFRSRCHTSCWCRYVTACSICAPRRHHSGTGNAAYVVRGRRLVLIRLTQRGPKHKAKSRQARHDPGMLHVASTRQCRLFAHLIVL